MQICNARMSQPDDTAFMAFHFYDQNSVCSIKFTRSDSHEYCKCALFIDMQSNIQKTKFLTFKSINAIPNRRYPRAHALSVAPLLCETYSLLVISDYTRQLYIAVYHSAPSESACTQTNTLHVHTSTKARMSDIQIITTHFDKHQNS